MKSGAEHLAGCLAIVELFSEQLNPLQHGRLEKEAQWASTRKAGKTSSTSAELLILTFSLEWMNVSRTNDVLSCKRAIVKIVWIKKNTQTCQEYILCLLHKQKKSYLFFNKYLRENNMFYFINYMIYNTIHNINLNI